ncbi:3363_t:CDS:2, partial [Acaulospora morrowiae]
HLLVEAAKAGRLPQTLQDVEIGTIVPGYVRNITDYAVFISFLGGFSAKAMRHMIADHYVASPVGIFYPNQSVICRIASVDTENSRCEVSLKPSEVNISSLPFITKGDFIKSYFSEMRECRHLSVKEQKVRIGECVEFQVKKQIPKQEIHIFKARILLKEDENIKITVSINEDHAGGCENIEEGVILRGVVLDFDAKGKLADISMRSELMNENKITREQNDQEPESDRDPFFSHRKELRKISKTGKTVDAIVELVKEDYIIVSLPEQGNTIAFAASKYYNDRSQPFMRYKFGQRAKAQITYVPRHKEDANFSSRHGSIDRVLVTLQFPTEQQERSHLTSTKTLEDFSPGEKIKGAVTAVENYGIFIKINDTSISGLCHISKISDEFVRDLSSLYKVGQRVTAVILGIDHKAQKISFGLKESCFKAHNLELSDDSDAEHVMEVRFQIMCYVFLKKLLVTHCYFDKTSFLDRRRR